ncbi:otopetrin-2-like protein, partial [Dinothrombium tinctorium]
TLALVATSSIYGQLLIVICIVFFVVEISTPQIPLFYFEGYYFFLYIVSLAFLLYIYLYLLKGEKKTNRVRDDRNSQICEDRRETKKQKIGECEKSHGSIFLRIGAIVFGLGTMVFNGMEFGTYFEIPYTSPCYSILLGVNPILQATFTFVQMYFVFNYSRLMIKKFKTFARIGIMHLVATNICVWIRALGRETLHDLKESTSHSFLEELMLPFRYRKRKNANFEPFAAKNLTINYSNPCQREDIVGSVLAESSPYLYPFIIEYSLICAAFLYVMWKTIGLHQYFATNSFSLPTQKTEDAAGENLITSHPCRSKNSFSCVDSKKGLFIGLLLLVISVTSLIVFFVLLHHRTLHLLAILISDLSQSLLLLLCCIASVAAYIEIRKLRFQTDNQNSAESGLRDILLKASAFGLYIYSLFGVIAGVLKISSPQHFAVFLTSILTFIQVTLQSILIEDVVFRKRVSSDNPGRQLITFLLISNITLWIIYTFEMQKVEASPVQLDIFGFTTWTLIVRITLPLSIFYRFHSAITFA